MQSVESVKKPVTVIATAEAYRCSGGRRGTKLFRGTEGNEALCYSRERMRREVIFVPLKEPLHKVFGAET
jgi:hypothetical protein